VALSTHALLDVPAAVKTMRMAAPKNARSMSGHGAHGEHWHEFDLVLFSSCTVLDGL
jgi:hypothetical protein